MGGYRRIVAKPGGAHEPATAGPYKLFICSRIPYRGTIIGKDLFWMGPLCLTSNRVQMAGVAVLSSWGDKPRGFNDLFTQVEFNRTDFPLVAIDLLGAGLQSAILVCVRAW